MTYLLAYMGTVVAFLGLDFIWLGTVATGFYRSRIGSLLLDQPNFLAAGVFYLFYVAGIVYLPFSRRWCPETGLQQPLQVPFSAWLLTAPTT